ncbi:MAG TPA: permease-like cell division protein FtsX [Thermoanaerobaculia bacterium]|nr:permease-like cell division protein FtsX [Thermoanaerobaculia bacterium]
MSFLQALLYFFREALVNLLRSWKVGLLAVLTITVSLLVGGAFLLMSRNLAASVGQWQKEMRVVIYLRPDTGADELRRLAAEAGRPAWVAAVEPVTAEAARDRFTEIFPTLSDLVEGWEDEPLPASLEIRLGDFEPATLETWLAGWRRRPEVSMVDDDREWLRQVATAVAVVRGVGLALGAGLLAAAIFTIMSVIRLTAYLHHEEISIMRLVGATEFYIRGPFYAEGLLQGLLGGGLASAGLYGAYQLLHARSPGSLFTTVLAGTFLSWREIAFLILLGGGAGLLGAVASLRRESL